MWRSSYGISYDKFDDEVFSTYVEVILKVVPENDNGFGILHVCGGHPYTYH